VTNEVVSKISYKIGNRNEILLGFNVYISLTLRKKGREREKEHRRMEGRKAEKEGGERKRKKRKKE
jgi:hypothetical protein